MPPELELPLGLVAPAFQEGFDPKRDLDPARADLIPEQSAFVAFAKGHEGRFDIYGVDASQNFMVTGLRHERGVKTIYRQYFTPADPNNPYSLSDIFPFRIDQDIWLTQEKEGEVSVDRVINKGPNGQDVNVSFDPGAEFITLDIGRGHIGITYVHGRFSHFDFFNLNDSESPFSRQSEPLEPHQVGKVLPEFKWHKLAYLDGGETLLFKGLDEGVQARIPMSVNRHLIIGNLLSPQMRQDPANFSPALDEYWQKADLVDLFGVKIEPTS